MQTPESTVNTNTSSHQQQQASRQAKSLAWKVDRGLWTGVKRRGGKGEFQNLNPTNIPTNKQKTNTIVREMRAHPSIAFLLRRFNNDGDDD